MCLYYQRFHCHLVPPPTKTLTIEDAVKFAVENDASLQQGKIALDQTKRESSHSANSFLPSIAAEGIIAKAGDLNDNHRKMCISPKSALSHRLRLTLVFLQK